MMYRCVACTGKSSSSPDISEQLSSIRKDLEEIKGKISAIDNLAQRITSAEDQLELLLPRCIIYYFVVFVSKSPVLMKANPFR